MILQYYFLVEFIQNFVDFVNCNYFYVIEILNATSYTHRIMNY